MVRELDLERRPSIIGGKRGFPREITQIKVYVSIALFVKKTTFGMLNIWLLGTEVFMFLFFLFL